jgi:transmembrane sensor
MPTAIEISAIAADWLIRSEKEATVEQWEALQGWLEADPRHRAAFIRLRTAWNRCDKLKMLRPADGTIDAELLSKIEFVDCDEQAAIEPQPLPAHGRRDLRGSLLAQFPRRRWLAAAAFAAVAVLGTWYGAFHSGWDSFQTEVGGRRQLALADRSIVELNTDSELQVRMTASRRDLVLKRGEALFHVAHDASRPFYVTAGGTVVRAVGTAFSVRIHEDNHVDILVTEGKVAVGTPEDANEPTLPTSAAAIAAGDFASVRHHALSTRRVYPAEMSRKLAWTTGYISFQGETLTDAVNEFNRYNRRRLVIADSSLPPLQMGASFHVYDLESFVAALAQFGVKALWAPDGSEIKLIAAPLPAAAPPATQSRDTQHSQDPIPR